MLKLFTQRLRATLIAGLLVVVPLAVTAWVLVALVQFLDSVVGLVPRVLTDMLVSAVPFLPVTADGRPAGFGILLATVTVLALGLATRSYLGRAVITFYENLLNRVPVLSSVYQAIKELLEMLFSRNAAAFERVVLVEWPREGVYSIGFLTGEAFAQIDGQPRLVNVFVPTSPNPTTGFYFMTREDKVVPTDMTVEEGFKMLLSAGIVAPTGTLHLPPDIFRRGTGAPLALPPRDGHLEVGPSASTVGQDYGRESAGGEG